MPMEPDSARPLAKGLKHTIAATGALAMTWAAATDAAKAAPVPKPMDTRFADAFNSWSFGFGGGFGAFQAPAAIQSFDYYATNHYSPTLTAANPFASIEFGKDFRVKNGVFGVFGDFHLGDQTANFISSDTYAPAASLTLHEGGSVTARAGFLADQRTLFYGLAGWAWQRYSAAVTGNGSASASGILNGPTAGVGLELLWLNHPNISFKTEYRFTHLSAPDTLTASGGKYMSFGAVDEQALRLILSFKMGAPPG